MVRYYRKFHTLRINKSAEGILIVFESENMKSLEYTKIELPEIISSVKNDKLIRIKEYAFFKQEINSDTYRLHPVTRIEKSRIEYLDKISLQINDYSLN